MQQFESYRSPKVEIKNSEIAEKGIFAKYKIRKDEVIAIKSGYILSKNEFNNLDEECKKYCLQIEEDFFLGPKNKEEIRKNAIFINHSCDPNVGFQGEIIYVAMRDIEEGEELTHDYAMCFTDLSHFSDLKCNCGSKNCRKKILSSDWMSKELQAKYSDYFSNFILKKIK
jgi:uncharacterized protein